MSIKIQNRSIGEGHPCFIIAEAGINHNGDVESAKKLIDVAKSTKCDAVKFQTFKTENLVTKNAKKAKYQQKMTGKGSQFDMIKKLELSYTDFKEISNYSKEKGIIFLSTPFDEDSVDLLEELEVPAYKVGSGDLTHLQLLEYIAKKDKPMIVSTGMATLDEVKDAVNTIKMTGNEQIVLMHCTSNYPVKIEDCNLRAIDTLRKEFRVPVGYSDHTLGISVSIAAVALGISVIEKHFTLNKKIKGPDHSASLEPNELKEMVTSIRLIEKALGSEEKKPVQSELETRRIARKSIVIKKDIAQGLKISKDLLMIKRPGTGIEPKHIDKVIGKRAKHELKKDEVLTWEMIE